MYIQPETSHELFYVVQELDGDKKIARKQNTDLQIGKKRKRQIDKRTQTVKCQNDVRDLIKEHYTDTLYCLQIQKYKQVS